MVMNRNKKAVDPEYFEQVGIVEFLVPMLAAERTATTWLRHVGIELEAMDNSTATVRRLTEAFAGSAPPPPTLAKLMLDLESVSTEAVFNDLLQRLNEWGQTPPESALNEYNLPLWTRVHFRSLLDGFFDEAHDVRPRRLVEFAPRHAFSVDVSDVPTVIDRLAQHLGPLFESVGRSRLCYISPHFDGHEVALYVHHGTTLKQRALVSDDLLSVQGVDPVLQAQQRDKATMAVRLCMHTGRLRVSARSNFDADRLRGALGEAIFEDASSFQVASRISLAQLFARDALQTPPEIRDATVLEVRLSEGQRGGWSVVVRHRDILANRALSPVDLTRFRPVYAKFGLRPDSGGRARTVEVYEPNAMRASKALSDATVEAFLSLNGLMTVDGAHDGL